MIPNVAQPTNIFAPVFLTQTEVLRRRWLLAIGGSDRNAFQDLSVRGAVVQGLVARRDGGEEAVDAEVQPADNGDVKERTPSEEAQAGLGCGDTAVVLVGHIEPAEPFARGGLVHGAFAEREIEPVADDVAHQQRVKEGLAKGVSDLGGGFSWGEPEEFERDVGEDGVERNCDRYGDGQE
jgi:hypothetical protein